MVCTVHNCTKGFHQSPSLTYGEMEINQSSTSAATSSNARAHGTQYPSLQLQPFPLLAHNYQSLKVAHRNEQSQEHGTVGKDNSLPSKTDALDKVPSSKIGQGSERTIRSAVGWRTRNGIPPTATGSRSARTPSLSSSFVHVPSQDSQTLTRWVRTG
jgi:hypothetical protein